MLLENIASFGGGIYAEFSHIEVQLNTTNDDGTGGILFFKNIAMGGGGTFLNSSVVSNVYLCASNGSTSDIITINFTQNSAGKGGAVYFTTEASIVKCYFQNECYLPFNNIKYSNIFISFSNNFAERLGASVFGNSSVQIG